MKIKIRSPSFCKDTLDNTRDVINWADRISPSGFGLLYKLFFNILIIYLSFIT
jgi:hypothetical protein